MTAIRHIPVGAPGPPGVIRLVEQHRNGDDETFWLRAYFGDDRKYDVEVTDPGEEADETLLAWYFEQHLRYPSLDRDRVQEAVRQIALYGEALFRQVFGGAANGDYRNLRERSFDGCRLEVMGSTALHRLHWEALRDPELNAPLAVRLPIVRQVRSQVWKPALPAASPTLNVLVATARPDGPEDEGYRTISRPLLGAIRPMGLPVTVDLVRPGTWEALQRHLDLATERHGVGWYHIVHFDLHGLFTDYGSLYVSRLLGRYQFSSEAPERFAGRRGFLLFESALDGVAELVRAEAVATLLTDNGIPVAVLNACQSAMQSANEASLAQRLAEAGVQVAIGMAYSITVPAAVRAVPTLYGSLADAAEPAAALYAARRELYANRSRQAYFDQQIDLEDWMLPVMFEHRPLQIHLREMTRTEQTQFDQQAEIVGEEPATPYGFVGRDLDIQAIEHRLLANRDSNELLVQGMAGAGKSTLLAHLAWWWQRTGLVERVFHFSYEDRAWTSGQIIRGIQAALFSAVEQARADSMPEAEQIEQTIQRLRTSRHLLIVDNAESITAAPASIPHSLSHGEQQQLKTLLSRLHGGQTLVLIGSREPETWLTSDSSGPGIYLLPSLDSQAASLLVDRILRRHEAAHYLENAAERDSLEKLVTLLGGYPLPLTVVLSVLASAAPSTVLAELEAGDYGADPARLMHRAIAYSYDKLDLVLQRSLLLLAPFTAVIHAGPALRLYQELLSADEAMQGLGPIDLAAALDEAIAVGLAVPHPQFEDLVQVQPVLPYFLRSRLHDRPALRTATSQAHYQLYCYQALELGRILTSPDMAQSRTSGRASIQAEYANLNAALGHGLRTSQPIITIAAPLAAYLMQTEQFDACRQLLNTVIAAYAAPVTQQQQQELAAIHDGAGRAALALHRLDDAKEHYQTGLRLAQAAGDWQLQSSAFHQDGRIAHEQRRYDESEANYRKALDISLENGDQKRAASVYHNLAVNAYEQQRYHDAEDNCRKALDIYQELGDIYETADIYGQLGMIAQDQQLFTEARASFRKALEIYSEFGDRTGAGKAYQQIGAVADLQGRFGEADASYRKALDIRLEVGDQHSAASTYMQLGVLAQREKRFAEAEASYRKALHIFMESGDLHRSANSHYWLGQAAHEQRQFTEAEASYRKALDIYRESDDRYQTAEVHFRLGWLAQDQRQFAYAETSYRKALDIYSGIGNQHSAANAYQRLGIIAQDQQKYEEAEASYRKALDNYIEQGDRNATARTYYSLGTLAEDQRQYENAEAHYLEAIHLYIVLGDQEMASISATQRGIVLANLGQHSEAVHFLVYATLTGLQESGEWLPKCMQWLHQERELLGPDEFLARVKDQVPDSAEELVTGIEAAWNRLRDIQDEHENAIHSEHLEPGNPDT